MAYKEKLYKTVIQVTVLGDEGYWPDDLSTLHYDITDGRFSGSFDTIGSPKEISKRDMAVELRDQGSDPEFLLGSDGWKYGLTKGDEVKITSDNSVRTVKIRQIWYPDDETFLILDVDDGEHKGRVDDLK